MQSYQSIKQQEFNQEFDHFFDSFLLQTVPNQQIPPELLFLINDQSHFVQQNGKILENYSNTSHCCLVNDIFQMFQSLSHFLHSTCYKPIRRKFRSCKKYFLKKYFSTQRLFNQIYNRRIRQQDAQNKKNFINYRMESNKFIFQVSSPIRLIWDCLGMIFIIMAMMFIPFRLSFEEDENQWDIFELLDNISDCFFMFDILLNFNTAIFQQGSDIIIYYYKLGQQVYDRKVIAINYIKFWFWLDLLSSFPFGLILLAIEGSEQNQYSTAESIKKGAQLIRIFKIFKFFKVIKLLRIVKLKVLFERFMDNIFCRVFQTLLISSFLSNTVSYQKIIKAHLIACIWHGIAFTDDDNNWLISQDLENADWQSQYLSSIYWAVTTMVAIGYGDIVPQNKNEKIVAIGAMLLACVIYGYIMETLNRIVIQMERLSTSEKAELQAADKYMRQKDLTIDLQVRVHKYLEYVQENRRKNLAQEANLISQLPQSLQTQLFICENQWKNYYKNCFVHIQFFVEFTLLNGTHFKRIASFSRRGIIQNQKIGSQNQNMCMYFVKEGQVLIFLESTGTILSRIESKSNFGDIGFFTGIRTACAKTSEFSDLFVIYRNDFLKLISKFPKDKEKFNFIKDSLALYKDYSVINLCCYICQTESHIATECPVLTAIGDRTSSIYQLYTIYKNFNKNYNRRLIRRKNFRRTLKECNESVRKIQEVYLSDLVNTESDGEGYKFPKVQIFSQIEVPLFEEILHIKQIDNQLLGEDLNDNIFSKLHGVQATRQVMKSLKKTRLSQINIAEQMIVKKVYKKIQKLIQHQNLIIEGFETVKSYKYYFPHNNVKKVMKKEMSLMKSSKTLSIKKRLSRALSKINQPNQQDSSVKIGKQSGKQYQFFDSKRGIYKLERQNNMDIDKFMKEQEFLS